jgi:hypothetical protein
MLYYVSKGEIYVEVPPKKIQCIFHDAEEKLTAFALREKEGNQLAWSFQHLFQNLPDNKLKEWVTIKTILPLHDLYPVFKSKFEEELNQTLDVNEPIVCFQFAYIPQIDEATLPESQCVFLLRRFIRNKCLIKFKQIK